MQAEADADLDIRWHRYERVRDREDREASKYTRYCLDQCDLLGALAELEAKERPMYELQNGKDQCHDHSEAGAGKFGHVGAGALVSPIVCPRNLGTPPPVPPFARQDHLGHRPRGGGVADIQ